MRAGLFLGLAAYWCGVAPASADRAGSPTPKPSPYVLPKQVADALANAKLAGNVLVPALAAMHPTAAAARGDAEPARGKSIAMRVIKDHGDVIEVSTAPVADCMEGWDQPYELRVFLKRDKLALRANADLVKTFADGTGVAINRGMPVSLAAGLGWESAAFTDTRVLPDLGQLTYATPAKLPPAALPALAGERLVCDPGPMTMTAWQDQRRRAREAELRREDERRRANIDARRAELEARRAEAQRECEAQEQARQAAAKRAKKTTQGALADDLGILGSDCASMSFLGADLDSSPSRLPSTFDSPSAPYCGVHDPSTPAFENPPKAKPPTVNGNAVDWPSYGYAQNDYVVKHGASYLADIGYRCGRVRVAVDAAGVRRTGGGGMIMGGGQIEVWIPRPGPVTWPDGSPAGKYTGKDKKYSTVIEQGDRICVHVTGVAEMVCHAKKTTAKQMALRYDVD